MREFEESQTERSGAALSAADFGIDLCCRQSSTTSTRQPDSNQVFAAAESSNSSKVFAAADSDQMNASLVLVSAESPPDLPRRGTTFWGESPDASDIHTGRRALGKDVMDKLDDWDWLIANRKQLQRGLETAYGKMTPDAFREFIKDLNEKSGGKIYIETGNGFFGSMNPLNPPGDLVVRCYLKRGGLYTDDKIMDSRNLTYSPTYQSGARTHDSRK